MVLLCESVSDIIFTKILDFKLDEKLESSRHFDASLANELQQQQLQRPLPVLTAHARDCHRKIPEVLVL